MVLGFPSDFALVFLVLSDFPLVCGGFLVLTTSLTWFEDMFLSPKLGFLVFHGMFCFGSFFAFLVSKGFALEPQKPSSFCPCLVLSHPASEAKSKFKKSRKLLREEPFVKKHLLT